MVKKLTSTAIIPARYASERFPGKPLAKILGKPMIMWVYDQVKKTDLIDRVFVATDDERIYETVKAVGGEAIMTSSRHRSGTDRIAEAAKYIESDLIINVQGDEPLIKPEMIRKAIKPFSSDASLQMATLKKEIKDKKLIEDPDLVKVITDKNDFALYFSRAPIPYGRNFVEKYYQHIGIYVYRKSFLLTYSELEPTPLERAESLEQLRALENGYSIKAITIEGDLIGVDQPKDIKLVEETLQRIENSRRDEDNG